MLLIFYNFLCYNKPKGIAMEQKEKQLDLDFFKRKTDKKIRKNNPQFLLFYFSDILFTFLICTLFIFALAFAENDRVSPNFSQYQTAPIDISKIENSEINNNNIYISQKDDVERLKQQVIEINNTQTPEQILNKSFDEFSLELSKTLKEKESLIPQLEKQE